MRMRWVAMGILLFLLLVIAQGSLGQGVTDKTQVAFQQDKMGYVFLASGVDLRNYDTVVIGDFSIAGLPDIGPGRLEGYRDTYRNHLKNKLAAAGVFKEVTDDQSKATGPKSLVIWGDVIAMHPGSTAARTLVGFGAGKAVAEIKTYVSTAEEKKILLGHHLRPTSGIRGGYGSDALGWLYQGVDKISTTCVEYIKRVYTTGR